MKHQHLALSMGPSWKRTSRADNNLLPLQDHQQTQGCHFTTCGVFFDLLLTQDKWRVRLRRVLLHLPQRVACSIELRSFFSLASRSQHCLQALAGLDGFGML
ncbi:MAG TPA: hypothetical protein VFV38_08145 [Ktedonobacteraceae bacterium]|nr:hypothetical protein [Ktedonobacteraceae bacterium]